MPVDAFANAVDLMQKAQGLVEAEQFAGSPTKRCRQSGTPVRADAGQAAAKSANASPNFSDRQCRRRPPKCQ